MAAGVRRLRPADIEAAYDRTRFGVVRRLPNYFSDDGRAACGLAAYAVANLVDMSRVLQASDPTLLINAAFRDAGFDPNYRRGFASGFDGDRLDPKKHAADLASEAFMLGHADGLEAWDAVKHLEL